MKIQIEFFPHVYRIIQNENLLAALISFEKSPLILQDVGQEMSVNLKLNLSIVNALWVLLAGDRFELEDPKLQAIVSKFDDALRIQTGFQNVKDQILLKISPELFKKGATTASSMNCSICVIKPTAMRTGRYTS